MGRARGRRWRRAPAHALVRAPWFLGVLLAERLPVAAVNKASLAACRQLGATFTVEHADDIEAAITGVKAKFGDGADLDDYVEAALPSLLAWARSASGIGFTERALAPYR